jgi:type IV pilus assembly protein PilC
LIGVNERIREIFMARYGNKSTLATPPASAAGPAQRPEKKTSLKKENVFSAPAGSEPALLPPETRKRGSIGRRETVFITTQLSVMVDTGVPLAQALETITDQYTKPLIKTALQGVLDEVRNGKDLSTALINCPWRFPHILPCLIRASEASGTMGPMLDRVAEYLTRENEIVKKLRTPLIYPAFMLVLTIAATILMFTFLLPRFEVIYSQREALLPMPTRVAMAISKFLRVHWIPITAGTAGLVAGLVYSFFTAKGQQYYDWLKLNFPILNQMFRKFYLARSIRTMGTLIASGLTIPDAVRFSRDVTGNSYFANLWTQADAALQNGQRLADTLFASDLIPNTIAQMIATGEKTGQMAPIMERISKLCEMELEDSIKTITSMLEPLMILIMGGVVGGIAFAVLLPIFQISKIMGAG